MLIVAKIRNQAAVLHGLGRLWAKALLAMAERVGSGDPANIEAQAARSYWSDLFCDFTRGNDTDRRNALLNYGYAVVRAALARSCVAAGLLPAFGLDHASRSNAFNLVDDLIEPFRPLVDRLVHDRAKDCPGDELTIEDRRHMAAVLNQNAAIGRDHMTLLAATEAVALSTVRAMEHNSAALLRLPQSTPKD